MSAFPANVQLSDLILQDMSYIVKNLYYIKFQGSRRFDILCGFVIQYNQYSDKFNTGA